MVTVTDEVDGIRNKVRNSVMHELDMTDEIRDEDVSSLIDRCIIREMAGEYIPLKEKLSLKSEIFNSIRRMDVLSDLLQDDEITEIMINGYENIFIEREGRLERYPRSFEDPERLTNIIRQMVSEANRTVNETNPIVDAVLSDGSRINVVLSGVSRDGSSVTIRKFPKKKYSMDRLVEMESVSREAADFLGLLVRAGYNIFISGGTGSGKTTFLNALTEYIPSDERVVTIEDSAELCLTGVENLIRLETRNANVEGSNEITIRDLIKCSLRMRPDRIVVGEVRDSAAVDMIQAMCTGHDGSLSTGHANTAKDMLMRLEMMMLMGSDRIPLSAIRRQITAGIDIVVHLGRLRDKTRRVLEIIEVTGMREDEILTNTLYSFVETGEEKGKVRGGLRKKNDLLNISKLCEAGLISIVRENSGWDDKSTEEIKESYESVGLIK